MCPLFSPPLFMQRYEFVVNFVQNYGPKKVLDLGCADCSLLRRLKYHASGVELLVGVDKDSSAMRTRMHSFAPLSSDYLQPRAGPLSIEFYEGSVTQSDPSTRGFDLVTCIELIEHLEIEEVDMFSEVLFGYMSPTAVIISTPNADYNPLLPGLVGFRHPDHKFEWSREQFQLWALRWCELFGYTVNFTGVGVPTDSTHADVGFCSQIAVFKRNTSLQDSTVQCHTREEPSVYKLLYSVVYPSLSDNNILQKTLVNEVLSRAELVKRSWLNGEWLAKGTPEPYMSESCVCVCLLDVWSCPRVRALCGTLRRFTEALVGETRVTLTPGRDAIIMPVDVEEEEEEDDDEEEEAENGQGAETRLTASVVTEDWDAEIPRSSNLPDSHSNLPFSHSA